MHSSAFSSLICCLYRLPHSLHFNTPCCFQALLLTMCVFCILRPPGKLGPVVLFLRIFPIETAQQRLMNTPVVSQFRNLSCTQGRSPLVCYINNNKLSFHGASPVLSSHGDVRHLWILSVVFPLSTLCCKSYTHHFPRYPELDLEVICKVGGFSNGLNGWEMTSER